MGIWGYVGLQDTSALTAIIPTYNYTLGWVAGLLAIFAGIALFPTLERVGSSRTTLSRISWQLGGMATMSIGFWGTQNMALLSIELPAHYFYNPVVGFAALLPCMAGCAVAIHVLASPQTTAARLHAGAASLAVGVAGMHHTLMAAIDGDVILVHDPGLMLLSLALGYGFSLIALYANRELARLDRYRWAGWLGGSVLLGVTVLGNHFSAMAGTSFFDDPAIVSSGVSVVPAATIPLVAGCVLFLVTAFWVGSLVDGRLAEASAAVRSSEAHNRAIIESMMDAHMVTDRDGIIRSFNPAAEETFGWPAGEIIGQPVTTLINYRPEARQRPFSANGDRLVSMPAHRRRWVYADGGRRKDGSVFPVELAVSPFTVDGNLFFSCKARDLTERWEAEARLRRLAAATENAGDAICILDAGHRIQYVNPQYERQSGFSRDEVIGQQPGRGVSADSVYAEVWSTVARGQVWTGQVRTRRRDGSVIDEELTVTPVFSQQGAISGYVAVMRDITRRLEAELDRRRLAEALQYCTDSIEILDAQGRILYVNAAYERYTGQRLADIRGSRPEALLDFEPAADSYDDMMRTAYRGGRPWSGTLKSVHPDGRVREEDVTVSPMRDDRGQIHGYVVVKRDTTDRRRLEAQSRQRQKLESIGQLAGGIAQELNRPVQQLGDNLQFLGRSFRNLDALLAELLALAQSPVAVTPAALAGCLQSADAEFLRLEMARALGQAADGVQQVSSIVGAMRDLSYASPEQACVDLGRAIQSTITVSSSEWRAAAEVRTTFDPALPPVRCVAGDIGLVVMNMLAASAQAILAANKSGIRGKGVITVSTQRLQNWAEIRISHTGKGVSPEERQRLFNPSGADAPAAGMALAHDVVVRRHNGTLAVESDGAAGATFIIRLPLDAAASPSSTTAAA